MLALPPGAVVALRFFSLGRPLPLDPTLIASSLLAISYRTAGSRDHLFVFRNFRKLSNPHFNSTGTADPIMNWQRKSLFASLMGGAQSNTKPASPSSTLKKLCPTQKAGQSSYQKQLSVCNSPCRQYAQCTIGYSLTGNHPEETKRIVPNSIVGIYLIPGSRV
jgi:hypothetical protein